MRDLKSARKKPAYRVRPGEAVEPEMSAEDWRDFERGVELFNGGQFWESHEAWEQVWRRHPERARVFFQGLIQVAAAYHQLGRGVYHGVVKHFNNSGWKLAQFPDRFLGVDVAALRAAISAGLAEAERLGAEDLGRFDPDLVTEVRFQRPEE